MIQDIYPHKLDNSFKLCSPKQDDVMLFFCDGKVLCKYNEDKNALEYPLFNSMIKKDIKMENNYLYSIDDTAYFLLDVSGKNDLSEKDSVSGKDVGSGKYNERSDTNTKIDLKSEIEDLMKSGYNFYEMRELRRFKLSSNEGIFAAYTAKHLWKWYDDYKYCGSCGTLLERDTVERALVCTKCSKKIYPRINPAVIVGIINNDKIVITRYRDRPFSQNALVAGFVEIGETLEETVQREVMEEVGLRVKNIRYYKSQPWGIAEDILVGFFCELDGDPTIKMDEGELKYAEWTGREELELQKGNYSLTNEMMKLFKDGKASVALR